MDFKLADEYAERIQSGDGDELFEELIRMCTPYLLDLRKRFGFYRIPPKEVRNEIVADTVSDAIVKNSSKLPFSYRLQNTFRNLCRQKEKTLKDRSRKHLERLIEKHQALGFSIAGLDLHRSIAEPELQQREEKSLVLEALKGHPEFSKKVVFQRFRGSTFPEISEIYQKAFDECKRVFWHDFYHIQKELSRIQKEVEK